MRTAAALALAQAATRLSQCVCVLAKQGRKQEWEKAVVAATRSVLL